MELCTGAGVPNQGSCIAEVMPSADFKQLRQSWLTTGHPPPKYVGTDPVCAPSWNYLTES